MLRQRDMICPLSLPGLVLRGLAAQIVLRGGTRQRIDQRALGRRERRLAGHGRVKTELCLVRRRPFARPLMSGCDGFWRPVKLWTGHDRIALGYTQAAHIEPVRFLQFSVCAKAWVYDCLDAAVQVKSDTGDNA